MTHVVFAMQAPTLLNILATSREWDLSVQDLGDTQGLAEVALSNVKPYSGERVTHVFVCSPAQYEAATQQFARSRIWWVLHTGSPTLITPSGVHDVLVFSNSMKKIHQARNPLLNIRVVTPSYVAERTWRWAPGIAWAMRNRPTTRNPESLQLLQTVGLAAGDAYTCYGQGWPAGFLTAEQVHNLRTSCSAYVSALPKWAGFGLAEHECFAAGVPVVSSRWGDMDQEMPKDYWSLNDSIEAQQEALRRLVRDREPAERLAEIGMDFIRTYRTQERMDAEIGALLASE